MTNEVAMMARSRDDEIADLLLGRAAEAHRLAAWILRDPVGAEDAVQDAALIAWNRRGSLRDAASADGWFSRIVVNVCRDELRRRARKRDLPVTEVVTDSLIGPGSDRVAERDELGRAISKLTPDQQVVLGLRFGRDLTVPQIAAETGLPEGTVKSRLHHSLENLRATLAAERRAAEANR
ncbi:MAG TPA: sigma-70 family RNA polymerase sigma factor [Candidatus Limnocylindrales bacterium]